MREEDMVWLFDYPEAYGIEEELRIVDDGVQDLARGMRRGLYEYEMANK